MLSAGSVHAQRPKRIGVVISVEVNTDPGEARALANDLGEAIRSELDLDVITGAEVERRLPAGGLPDECVANAECRTDIGRRLDADELLMLVVVKLGDDLQVDTTWAHVASGDSASRPQFTVSPDNRDTLLTEVVPRLLPHVEKDAPAPPRDKIVVVPTGGQTATTRKRHIPLGTWIAGGIGVGALIGGGVFALSAREKFDALDDDGCRDMACDEGRLDSLNRRALTADILFGVAGAATATAVVLYFVTPSYSTEKRKRDALVRPGPGDIGLAVGGDF